MGQTPPSPSSQYPSLLRRAAETIPRAGGLDDAGFTIDDGLDCILLDVLIRCNSWPPWLSSLEVATQPVVLGLAACSPLVCEQALPGHAL